MRKPTGALSLVCLPLAVLVLAGCAQSTSGAPATGPTAGEGTVSTEPVVQTAALRCGEQFRPPAGGPLTLAARFPGTSVAGTDPLTGAVDVTSSAPLHAVGPGRAEAFLVRDGLLVTLPLPQDSVGVLWDLVPGATKSVPAEASLVSCATGAALEPGSYDLFVRVVLAPDEGGQVESVGGPWSVRVG